VALCRPGDLVLSGSCFGTASLYFAGGPVVREVEDGVALGWECRMPDGGGSCVANVTALCLPRNR
jgi:hypothetical protein